MISSWIMQLLYYWITEINELGVLRVHSFSNHCKPDIKQKRNKFGFPYLPISPTQQVDRGPTNQMMLCCTRTVQLATVHPCGASNLWATKKKDQVASGLYSCKQRKNSPFLTSIYCSDHPLRDLKVFPIVIHLSAQISKLAVFYPTVDGCEGR